MADLVMQVDVGFSDQAVVGYDTLILAMPDGFYVDIEGKPTLVIQPFMRLLRELAVDEATKFGLRLHHADYVVTKDLEVVAARGSMHDCQECRDATDRVMRMMIEQPELEIIVGNLWWCD